jgi:hypothetical protein
MNQLCQRFTGGPQPSPAPRLAAAPDAEDSPGRALSICMALLPSATAVARL